MPIVGIFQQLKSMNYQGGVMLKYEIDADNPLQGMIKSFAYMRGVLDGLAAGEKPPNRHRLFAACQFSTLARDSNRQMLVAKLLFSNINSPAALLVIRLHPFRFGRVG